jgi:hypothetical protein
MLVIILAKIQIRVLMKKILYHIAVICLVPVLVSCASQGGRKLNGDNLVFANAVGNAMKEEALMSVVRLRYSDWPSFSEIKEIYLSHHWETKAIFGIFFFDPWTDKEPGHDYAPFLSYINRFTPKTLYQPMTGKAYTNAILTPTRLSAVFSLIKIGFTADDILLNFTQSLNGYNNTFINSNNYTGHQASFEVTEFARVMRLAQLQNALVIKPGYDKRGNEHISLRFRVENMDEDTLASWQALKIKLGLDSENETYHVIYAINSYDPRIIALRTRSVLEYASSLSIYVDVPESHLNARAVKSIKWQEAGTESPPLFRVRSGENPPGDAYAKVRYRDYWYWIDDTDPQSKNSLQNLLFLLHVTESDRTYDTQFVIPIN